MKESKSKNITKFSSDKLIESIFQGVDFQQFLTIQIPSKLIRALFALAAFRKSKKNIIVVSQNYFEQQDWVDNLSFFDSKLKILGFAESLKSKRNFDSFESLGFLIQNLEDFKKNESIAICTPEEFKIELPQTNEISKNLITLNVKDEVNFQHFTQELILNGYSKNDYVAFEGDIAIRGGIVDIYPIGHENPLRIEFWGDEIDSIREFDPLSQRSVQEHQEISFLKSIFHSSQVEDSVNIFEYLPQETIFILDSPENLDLDNDILEKIKNYDVFFLNPLKKHDFSIKVRTQPEFNGSLNELTKFLKLISEYNTNLTITSDNPTYTKRIQSLLEKYIEETDFAEDDSFKDYVHKINWHHSPVSEGFITNDFKYAVLTEHQIFERKKKVTEKHKTSKTSITLKELNTLQIGDFIVHEDKGVGIFDGLQTMTIGGTLQDCIRIKFQDDDLVYLNLNYINKIDRYNSTDGEPPKLSKLGSVEWERRKTRLKKKLKDISRELIQLYAKRKFSEGFSFAEDTVWQKEFEASFMYEDTQDQATASDDVKQDMCNTFPMDRLVCGDVGFGKTEVAIRAAFKAATSGKQVAVLVPTTILAQQHYMSFRDRFNRYPINVTLLSRFRSKKEINESLDQIKSGKIDVIVGTHRLLSKDVEFKDLGLLIIDEEHRFGVEAKEKLRQLKENIDTLTMTATPIPRTLNFSLLGVRDISIIETPPPNRLPVYTEVLKWDSSQFREAVLMELSRKGQIFFVTDKVYDIDEITAGLKSIVPEATFGIAHGQMKSSELENTMVQFIEKKFDVLVTTKIIESGLDIPNANTIFINRAQNFGLAELYQLRGRVGRSNIQAQCYLLVPENVKLPEKSIRRLQALEEFTDLGSGIKLAMRDMEIRGTGNLLGADQSGFIDDIGFELYSKILDEAVAELKDEEFADIFKSNEEIRRNILRNPDLEIDYDKSSFFTDSFVPSDTERYLLYKRLYALDKIEDVKDFENELIDRFGKLPEEVENLLFVIRIRVLGINTGFRKIQIRGNKVIIEFPTENQDYYLKVFPYIMDYIGTYENASFKQIKSKLILTNTFENREEILEYIWKMKKVIDLSIEE
ncbi:MAG: transcription-repair coupling factor [Ignavibacteria bacterium GWF2_33_9]|nr:MAG: transcription-repair coupling factor [Ignavibacteria bacterium GWF2_33_9]